MKTSAIIFAAAIAVTSVSAAPLINERDPKNILQEASWHYCLKIGEPCYAVKRAADAATAALDAVSKRSADADPQLVYECYDDGYPCHLAQNATLALRSAISVANDYANVFNGTNELETPVVVVPDASEKAKRDPKNILQLASWHYCLKIGEPCYAAKRAAEEIHAAYDMEPVEKRDPKNILQDASWHYCLKIGEPCYAAKRAIEYLKRTADDVVALFPEV